MRTLVVNKSYLPLHVVSWKRAVNLVCRERAELVEFHADLPLRTTNMDVIKDWGFPAVVRLKDFDFPPRGSKTHQHLNKHNLWVRDDGMCVYCSTELSVRTMTMDHVVPKSQGGKKSWTNLVCACKRCNGKKNNRTPEQAKMPLRKAPYAPTLNRSITNKIKKELRKYNIVPGVWQKYIFWVEA